MVLLGVMGSLKADALVDSHWVTLVIIFWLSGVLEISEVPEKELP